MYNESGCTAAVATSTYSYDSFGHRVANGPDVYVFCLAECGWLCDHFHLSRINDVTRDFFESFPNVDAEAIP